jgi:hypothetical protein
VANAARTASRSAMPFQTAMFVPIGAGDNTTML